MTRVRYACLDDLDRVVALARAEHAVSPWAAVAFDEGAARETARGFVECVGRTLLVSGDGYLAGMTQPSGFSRRLLAIEYAWFARDGSGLALLRRFESWARNMGAHAVITHTILDGRGSDDRALRVLRRRGYARTGSALTLNLQPQG